MKLVFWASVFWIGYVYLGYPLILKVLSLFRTVQPLERDNFGPPVAVLIAARNEEKDIGWKVTETLGWDYPAHLLSVCVASDASDDRTDEILRSIQDPRLIFLRMPKRAGKNAALNQLVKQAPGELLLFTDANSHIPPGCLRRVVRHFSDSRVGCVTGDTHPMEGSPESLIDSGASAYGGYESMIRSLENRLGSVLVCDGALFCVRKHLYSPLRPELANDLELPLKIGGAGYWVRHEPAARVFERDTSSPRQSFRQRRRIAAQGLLGMWRLRDTLRGFRGWQFVSRKFMRWLTPLPLAGLLVSTAALAASPWFRLLFAAQLIFYGLALAGWALTGTGQKGNRWFSIPFYVVLGSSSTLAGVIDACRGRRFAVWDVASLSRGENPVGFREV